MKYDIRELNMVHPDFEKSGTNHPDSILNLEKSIQHCVVDLDQGCSNNGPIVSGERSRAIMALFVFKGQTEMSNL